MTQRRSQSAFTAIEVMTFGMALLLSVAHCGDDDDDGPQDGGTQAAEHCLVGESEKCACEGGEVRTRVCLPDGGYTECQCPQETCTTPGVRSECQCEDGAAGDRVCMADGTYSKCICQEITEFDRCCHDLGSCVPGEMVRAEAGSVARVLSEDTCQDRDVLCVPDAFMPPELLELLGVGVDEADEETGVGGAGPEVCDSIGEVEGRCLPDCLAAVEEQQFELPQDTCPEHHLCVPCMDPFTADWTGACGIAPEDQPRRPSVFFESCCDKRGYCLPDDLVPEDQVSFLGEESCEPGKGLLCAPEVFIEDPDYVPELCESVAGSAGRCLPTCLGAVADVAVQLPQSTCEEGFACVPCTDALTGASTGACDLPGDTAPTSPSPVFDRCCNSEGSCVPAEIIDPDQVSEFTRDTCPAGEDLVCVPNLFTQVGGFVPETCRSVVGSEGRCLPDCIRQVEEAPVSLPRDICPEDQACVPCYDPLSGAPTGACDLPGDPGPREQVRLLERCCDGIGYCVPGDLVDEDEAPCLSEQTCDTGQGLLCAPEMFVEPDTDWVPQRCESFLGIEGRCLPQCLPDVQKQPLDLPQDVCPELFVCVPFYDPRNGEPAATCEVPNDREPRDRPLVFSKCCEQLDDTTLATCVPEELLPVENRGLLLSDSCDFSNGEVCVPDALLEERDAPLETCTTDILLGFPLVGGCMPDCAVDIEVDLLGFVQIGMDDLLRENCQVGEKCVPCLILEGLVPQACQ